MRPGRNPLPASPATISSPSYRKIIIRLAVRTLGLFNLSSPWQTRQSGAKSLFGPNPSRSHRFQSKGRLLGLPYLDCREEFQPCEAEDFLGRPFQEGYGLDQEDRLLLVRFFIVGLSSRPASCNLYGLPRGEAASEKDDTVENDRCLACHDTYDKLAEKTASPQFPKRNPHKAHVIGLACIKCHHAHSKSRVSALSATLRLT